MKKLTIFLLGLFAFGSTLAQTQVPNTFQAGQPARAAEVNANFDALETAIDRNAADITANISSIDSNAIAIAVNAGNISNNTIAIENNAALIASVAALGGITVYSEGIPVGRLLSFASPFFLLSDQSFVFIVHPEASIYEGGQNIYFTEAGCLGQALVENRNTFPAFMLSLGMVFPALDPAAAPASVYYSNRGSQPSLRTYSSVVNNNACINEQGTLSFYQVFPNDEQITGVPNTPPTAPFLIGAP